MARRISVSFVLTAFDEARHEGGTPCQFVIDWAPGLPGDSDPDLVALLREHALAHLQALPTGQFEAVQTPDLGGPRSSG